MVETKNLLDMQLMLFLLMAAGYLLAKLNILTDASKKSLTDLVLYVVLPANIVHSFIMKMDPSILISTITILLISLGIQLACLFGSNLLYRFCPQSSQMVLKYGTICSNAGFMGNPLVEGLYGSQGLLYASIYLIPQRVFMWSAGLSCFTPAKGKEVIKKVLTHPCIVAVYIGFPLLIFQIPLPGFAFKTIEALSNCTSALSMMVIGAILKDVDLRTIFSKLNAYYCFIRLILVPSIVLVVGYLLHLQPLALAVAVVLSGMPAGTTTAILASKYGGNEKLAVTCIFLSTVLSLVTIPALCMILEAML